MTTPSWQELLEALRVEARRPIPPPQDPPGVGRARLAEAAHALHTDLADGHIDDDDDGPT